MTYFRTNVKHLQKSISGGQKNGNSNLRQETQCLDTNQGMGVPDDTTMNHKKNVKTSFAKVKQEITELKTFSLQLKYELICNQQHILEELKKIEKRVSRLE